MFACALLYATTIFCSLFSLIPSTLRLRSSYILNLSFEIVRFYFTIYCVDHCNFSSVLSSLAPFSAPTIRLRNSMLRNCLAVRFLCPHLIAFFVLPEVVYQLGRPQHLIACVDSAIAQGFVHDSLPIDLDRFVFLPIKITLYFWPIICGYITHRPCYFYFRGNECMFLHVSLLGLVTKADVYALSTAPQFLRMNAIHYLYILLNIFFYLVQVCHCLDVFCSARIQFSTLLYSSAVLWLAVFSFLCFTKPFNKLNACNLHKTHCLYFCLTLEFINFSTRIHFYITLLL